MAISCLKVPRLKAASRHEQLSIQENSWGGTRAEISALASKIESGRTWRSELELAIVPFHKNPVNEGAALHIAAFISEQCPVPPIGPASFVPTFMWENQ